MDIKSIFGVFLSFSEFLEKILFYEVFSFPVLVILLIFTALYFSFNLRFPSLKYFKKSINLLLNNSGDGGILRTTQSLFTSLSSVVGIGSIGGVATAIYLGGAGAVFWLVLMSFFSMNTVFAEVLLAMKYKNVNESEKTVECAPVSYIREFFKSINFIKLGIILSICYAVLYFVGLLGTEVYQIKETINILSEFKFLSNHKISLVIIFNLTLLVIAYGGISRIAKIFEKLLPFVCGLYLVSILIILLFNFSNIFDGIYIIVKEAFSLKSLGGGIMGSICAGVKRAVYTNEAGLGTSTTPYTANKSDNCIKQAGIGSLNPFFVSVMCLLTGLAVVITGVYDGGSNGVLMVKEAFSSVSHWFTYILVIEIILISFSLSLSSAFYIQNIYLYIFGKKTLIICYLLQLFISVSAVALDLNEIVVMADTLYLSIAIPNLICLFCARKKIKEIYTECREKGYGQSGGI